MAANTVALVYQSSRCSQISDLAATFSIFSNRYGTDVKLKAREKLKFVPKC